MGTRPTPVVVCGAMAAHSQAALAAGAVDVVGALDALPGSPQYVTALRRHLRVASRVRVITHPRNRLRAKGLHRAPGADRRAPAVRGRPTPPRRWRPATSAVVVIGASTGGPPALATILADLPADLPVPVLVVQHMADGFVEGLATWLDGLSPLPVVMAQARPPAAAGRRARRPGRPEHRCCAPGLRVELQTPPDGQFHVPGVDAAFASAAATCGAQAVGVLLTGMGRDGAVGLRTMRDAGAMTIGQDEPTSVVWGMPAAAQALGAVEAELPLPAIAAAIVDGRRRRRGRCRGMKTLTDDDFARGPRLPARHRRAWCSTRAAAPGCPASWPTGCASAAPRTSPATSRRCTATPARRSGSGCSTASPSRRPTSSATPRRWRRCAAGCCPSCCAARPAGTGR